MGPEKLSVLANIDLSFMVMGRAIGSSEELYASVMIKFIVIDVPSLYNAIVSRQTQGELHMRLDVKYLTVTFESVKGNAVIFIDHARVQKVFLMA